MSILDAIADERNKQADIARRYAVEIKGNRPADEYGEINRSIIARWSRSGLDRIKRMAWSIINNENFIADAFNAHCSGLHNADFEVCSHPDCKRAVEIEERNK